MRRFLEPAAAIVGTFLAALEPASAESWSFGFNAFGPVSTDTSNNLTPATLATTYTSAKVTNVSANAPAAIDILDSVGLIPTTFTYALGLGSGPSLIKVTVEGIEWEFTEVHMVLHENRFVSAFWDGTVVFGNGLAQDGSDARLTQSCDQAAFGSVIACSNTQVTTENSTSVDEPASVAALGGALFGAGLLLRNRRRRS